MRVNIFHRYLQRKWRSWQRKKLPHVLNLVRPWPPSHIHLELSQMQKLLRLGNTQYVHVCIYIRTYAHVNHIPTSCIMVCAHNAVCDAGKKRADRMPNLDIWGWIMLTRYTQVSNQSQLCNQTALSHFTHFKASNMHEALHVLQCYNNTCAFMDWRTCALLYCIHAKGLAFKCFSLRTVFTSKISVCTYVRTSNLLSCLHLSPCDYCCMPLNYACKGT